MEDLSESEIILNKNATFQIHNETYQKFKHNVELGAQLIDFDHKTFL